MIEDYHIHLSQAKFGDRFITKSGQVAVYWYRKRSAPIPLAWKSDFRPDDVYCLVVLTDSVRDDLDIVFLKDNGRLAEPNWPGIYEVVCEYAPDASDIYWPIKNGYANLPCMNMHRRYDPRWLYGYNIGDVFITANGRCAIMVRNRVGPHSAVKFRFILPPLGRSDAAYISCYPDGVANTVESTTVVTRRIHNAEEFNILHRYRP